MIAEVDQKVEFPWWLILLEGIAGVIIGGLLLISPGSTTYVLVQFLGIYWLISGIFSVVGIFINSSMWGWKLFAGVLGVVVGIIILQNPLWSTFLVPTVLVIVIAILGLVFGVVYLIMAFKGAGWGAGILGALSIALGFLLLIRPFAAAIVLPWVFGIFAIVGGVIAIVHAFKIK